MANIREAIQASLETRTRHDLPLALEVAEVEVEIPAPPRTLGPGLLRSLSPTRRA